VTNTLTLIVEAFSALPDVTAIALGGSRASGQGDMLSDIDLYVFTTAAIPLPVRRSIAREFDPAPEIGGSWWGEADAWSAGNAEYDVMFWDAGDFAGNLRRVIGLHQPSLGYSTSFWFTIRNAACLYDRDGWFAELKALAEAPYPDALRHAIIAYNAPVLRSIRSSYRHQIQLAIERQDPVSVNHRITAMLASVFDIVFAATGTLHPGEKRQLSWLASLGDSVPPQLDHHIRRLLAAAGNPASANVLQVVDAICDDVDSLVDRSTCM
jgi:predicted nucleotidyltransferase